ncbi:hypothetical protein HYX08_02645 [Candidatus Woesearchaeota archaeon]|nr:hypothetical protein [Candidatus Woesearchaeota archaeon]
MRLVYPKLPNEVATVIGRNIGIDQLRPSFIPDEYLMQANLCFRSPGRRDYSATFHILQMDSREVGLVLYSEGARDIHDYRGVVKAIEKVIGATFSRVIDENHKFRRGFHTYTKRPLTQELLAEFLGTLGSPPLGFSVNRLEDITFVNVPAAYGDFLPQGFEMGPTTSARRINAARIIDNYPNTFE